MAINCHGKNDFGLNYLRQKWQEDADIIRQTLYVAWPAILESFFIAVVGMVDSLMVSRLGSYAVAAVGLTTQPKFVGLSLFIATNLAISAIVARRKGEQNRESANQTLMVAILFIIVAAIVISILTVIFADDIMRLCGSAPDTRQGAVTYYRIIMGGMIFNVISLGINAAQRGVGNTKIAMRTNLISNVVNIIGNYLLIGGNLGFPALGIMGAAIATVFGTVVACFMSILSIRKIDSFISIPYIILNKIKLSLEPLKRIINVGYSVFIEQILMRIGFMTTAITAAQMGTAAFSAHQVGMNCLSLSFSFGDGLQVAAVALIGQSLGQKRPDLAKRYGNLCLEIGILFAILVAIVCLLGGEALYRMFFVEEDIIAIGVRIINFSAVVILFQIVQVVYMGSLRGAGDTRYTAAASAVSITVIRTGATLFFCYVMNLGIYGVWYGILIDQFSRLLFGAIRFRKGKWVDIKV